MRITQISNPVIFTLRPERARGSQGIMGLEYAVYGRGKVCLVRGLLIKTISAILGPSAVPLRPSDRLSDTKSEH
ncbi:hypothetical protein SKAU_G00369500 [Synaphobranchus kaupii]|uniref:Uncharacterized protein n=1 Tax=Synaphobranchus kaupii TaxID=118154 RepID=A0A9Q1EFU4_SYNKA|nr:hypothetical protein SKAU_G00369500 [Synaphobranchus kaupii]